MRRRLSHALAIDQELFYEPLGWSRRYACPRFPSDQRRASGLAAPLLGACDPRWRGFETACRIHSFQSSQAWMGESAERLEVFKLSHFCEGGIIFPRLGIRSGFRGLASRGDGMSVGLRGAYGTWSGCHAVRPSTQPTTRANDISRAHGLFRTSR